MANPKLPPILINKAGAVKSRNKLRAGKYPDAWLLLKK